MLWSSGRSHVRRGNAGSLQENLIGSPCSLAPGFPLLGTAPRPNHRESSLSHWSLAPLMLWEMRGAWDDLASVRLDVSLDYYLAV